MTKRKLILPIVAAASLAAAPVLAQEAVEKTDELVAMERVVGAMNNPPALTDIESFDGSVEIIALSEVQAGVSSATEGDVDLLIEQNADWIEEMHQSISANQMLTASLKEVDASPEDVIAISLRENGDWLLVLDETTDGEAA